MKRLGLIGLAFLGAAATAGAQQPPSGKDEIPSAYKPPKGMCRIWLKDVPPAQQPAPTDCASAVKNVPQNGRVVFGDTDDDKREKPVSKGEMPKGEVVKGTTPVVPKKPPFR